MHEACWDQFGMMPSTEKMPALTRRCLVRSLVGAALLPRKVYAVGVGGHLRFAGVSSSVSDTLDPARMSTSNDYIRGKCFYDTLLSLDPQLIPRSALALRVESDDFLVWHVILRPGVRFHDGSHLTADDVVYSLKRLQDPSTGSQQLFLARDFAEVKAVGPLEVRITLNSPNAEFPPILTLDNFSIVRDGSGEFDRDNGTGPFRCSEFIPGVITVGVRNEAYWGDLPHIASFEMIAIADDITRHDALLSGDVDVISTVNPRLVAYLHGHGCQTIESEVGSFTNLGVRLDHSPGSSPQFVEAMKYLFDRSQIRDSVFLGYARIANDHPVPPEDPNYAHDLPVRAYDPDRAISLLRRAGLLDYIPELVCSAAATASVEMAVLLQNAASSSGWNARVKRMPPDGYWSEYWMKTPINFGNTDVRPSLDLMFAEGFASNAPMNESHWKNLHFDDLLRQSRQERDPLRRRACYHDMQALIRDEAGMCIPVFTTMIDGCTARVSGMKPDRRGQLMGAAFLRYVRIDESKAA